MNSRYRKKRHAKIQQTVRFGFENHLNIFKRKHYTWRRWLKQWTTSTTKNTATIQVHVHNRRALFYFRFISDLPSFIMLCTGLNKRRVFSHLEFALKATGLLSAVHASNTIRTKKFLNAFAWNHRFESFVISALRSKQHSFHLMRQFRLSILLYALNGFYYLFSVVYFFSLFLWKGGTNLWRLAIDCECFWPRIRLKCKQKQKKRHTNSKVIRWNVSPAAKCR